MSTLMLRLAGPLQSWGSESRFVRRTSETAPTKSGIIGLLAAAQGRRRVDEIEDLVGLSLVVRIDQEGVVLRDFHTAHNPKRPRANIPLSQRYYLNDAVFTAFLGGPPATVEGLAQAIVDPAFPISLGRRSCIPVPPVYLGVSDHEPDRALGEIPLQASRRERRRRSRTVRCSVQADAQVFPDEARRRRIRDVPLSFSPDERRYAYREVVETVVDVANPEGRAAGGHDPFAVLEGLA